MTSRLLEPELLRPDTIRQARAFALEDSGLLAAHPPGAATLAALATQARQDLKGGPALTEWERAVAAELLLLAQWNRVLAQDLARAASLEQQQPFGGGPALAGILGARAALALAPLDVAMGPPILQVWVLQAGADGRDWEALECRLEGAAQWVENGWHLAAVQPVLSPGSPAHAPAETTTQSGGRADQLAVAEPGKGMGLPPEPGLYALVQGEPARHRGGKLGTWPEISPPAGFNHRKTIRLKHHELFPLV